MNISEELREEILTALEMGRDSAYEEAQKYHSAMAGYRPSAHKQYDDDVNFIIYVIEKLKNETV
jgi:hypothetical protein